MIFRIRIFFAILLFGVLAACHPTENVRHNSVTDSDLKLIRDNLFIDNDGELYFRTQDSELKFSYLQSLGLPNPATGYRTSLRSTIDSPTWKRLGGALFSDKTNLYCRSTTSDGGQLYVVKTLNRENLERIFTRADGTWLREKLDKRGIMVLGLGGSGWHYTDGVNVVGSLCDDQGDLATWSPDKY